MADTLKSAAYYAAYKAVLEESIGIPANLRDTIGVCGMWSLRDLLGHLAYWDKMQAEELRAIAAGETYTSEAGDEHDINAREVANRATYSWDDVMLEVTSTYAELRPLVNDPGEDNAQFRIHEHWEEHLEQIWTWKQALNG